ncbi:DEAD/DEAH box helicase [Mucilaginibacter sp.]|jgi:superfamily II DNA/RNA helicase|uniref:DEAD/DEAH box helicase n=1 Tax=Mucilaginibacter sp. TaxID=1882438 RepID=UPI002B9039B5|nr:DEAD/DEAH box helicase [Mucilaginibacter sp.]HTI60103.1 DEAD/DEAH box helicase [Mucilaginibacter sp.]
MSIINKYRFLEQAYPDMLNGIGMLIQKNKLSHLFEKINITDADSTALNLAKELCEIKIIENWEEQHTESFKAFCATYFDIASLLPVDFGAEYFIYEQIKIITFGYIGEHWHFVRQYLKAQEAVLGNIDYEDTWNKRLLTKCYFALVGLVNKSNWNDIDHSISLINQLREEQADFEKTFLGQVDEDVRPYGASELVALYHLAKSIEILGKYLIEGRPADPEISIHYHLGRSKEFCQNTGNLSLDLLLRFFEALAVKMIRNTIWYTTRGINNWVTQFNNFISRQDKGVFELLYPQRESIIDGELLNPAHRAIIVNLPTSSGKTMIAEYKILQALNQFRQTGGWVAYVVPTKALVNQIYVQLNRDLGSIGLKVEKASGAIELDGFEQYLVQENGNETNFDVLITTYEKLSLLVRQGLGTTAERPLILTVVDEAHNIEEEKRGLTLELMLTTIKNDCELANFLLMTPDISNSSEVATWLAGDRGKEIRLELDWWQPNERVVGAIEAVGRNRTYDIVLRTLHTDKATYEIGEVIPLISCENAALTKSQVCGSKIKLASCLSGAILDINSPIIVLAGDVGETYTIAEHLYESADADFAADDDIDLLIKLVRSELGNDFPLAKYLSRRIAVHSSALPDEIKFLIEDLMAKEKLQALVSTTTIAQGINFPVAAVIMGAYNYPFLGDMPVRDFWNLAGRVGRAGQKSMGWVGMAVKNDADLQHVTEYVMKASEGLRSQLIKAIDNALRHADQDFGRWLYVDERWSAVLQYISHLRTQTEQQEIFLSQLEQKLQSTLGYRQLPPDKRTFLRERIRTYAGTLTMSDAKRADETGFSTVSVRQMIARLRTTNLSQNDWRKDQLFSEQNQSMQRLIGVMLETYEIRKSIDELSSGGVPMDRSTIARLVIDWVNGKDIIAIATKFYPNDDPQKAIQKATKALYKVIANAATWGLAALQKMPTSGVNWENLSDLEKKKMANIPAYLHYGVNTDEGVLMRKNNVPRTIANKLGELFNAAVEGEIFTQPSSKVSEWLTNQSLEVWNQVIPANSTLSGEEYKKVWAKLNGAM